MTLDDVEHVIELVEFLDHDHDFLSDPGAGEGQLDKLLVLKPVEDEQAVARLFERERGVELGFGARFESEVVAGTFAQVFLNHGRAAGLPSSGKHTYARPGTQTREWRG